VNTVSCLPSSVFGPELRTRTHPRLETAHRRAGAACIIWAFKTGGLPVYVMPLVFGGAPIVNVAVSMHSAYVRGEALMAVKQYSEAAAEFQKILEHRAIVGADPIGALAHLQLGRAFVLSGDKTKAKAAYHDFLTLWKDADPDVPILRQAKAEHAKLQ